MNYRYPIFIESFSIYDIFYNDNNQLIIITPYLINQYDINYIGYDNEVLTFVLHKCPHNHTFIYSLNISYTDQIKLKINDYIFETNVNKYPIFKDEIIFSTIVKDEDDFILPWINYHLRLGVTKFIIYDNSSNNTLSTILEDYIKQNIVLLIKWNYPYITNISGISGQTTQQNHSIYAFKNSKYIGLFDIDEYVNIQNASKLDEFFQKLIINENIDVNNISSFSLLNKFFYNPKNLSVNDNKFLKIFNCDNIKLHGCEKCFVLPKNVITHSVHVVTSGKPIFNVNHKYGYFNHYIYLNKSERGRNNTDLIDNTILRHLID